MCCTRYDRRTGPSHGLTAPSSLVQREWLVSYVEDASVLLRAFCTITQDGCLRIVNWAAHALVLDPWPATTWHIPIAWLVPTGNVGYTPLDNLHCAIGVRSLLTGKLGVPAFHKSIGMLPDLQCVRGLHPVWLPLSRGWLHNLHNLGIRGREFITYWLLADDKRAA